MLTPGTQIGGYRIEGLLGRGGMAVVYEATQLSLHRHIALKVLSAELSQDASFRARFQREARVHAAMDHAHIVPIYDFGELENESLFIVMRLVRGLNLKELVVSGELEPQRALRLLGPVADALDSAHEAGLVHRDIKPQNILVGPRDHGYLADFGLTRAPGDTSFTKSGQFVGTPDYMAPEQILGEHPGSSSDVYSFAAVVYECLTRSVPYPRPSQAAVIFAHVSDPPPRPSALLPELEPVDVILAKAMAKDPSERPATAVSFIQELAIALPESVARPPRVNDSLPSLHVESEPKPAPEPAKVERHDGVIGAPGAGHQAMGAPEAGAAEERAAPAVRRLRGLEAPSKQEVESAAAPLSGDGERTEQRSRRGLSTVSDRRRPLPAATEDTPFTARTIRLRKGVVAVALGLLALSTAIGLVVGGADGGPTPGVAPGAPFRAGAIVMRAPDGWRSRNATAPVGLALRHGRAFAARPGAAASLVAGMTSGGGATLLPRSFERTLAVPPKGKPVKMGALEALRYDGLRPRGAARSATLLVAPTTQGVATVICSGTAAERQVCEAAAATARTASGALAYSLAPRDDYARAAHGVLDRLADGRRIVLERWRMKKTRTAQARAAKDLAKRFQTATREFSRLPAGPRERIAHGQIVAELRAVAVQLTAMARAARAGRERAYARARTRQRAHERTLRSAVRSLDDVGYRVR